MIAWVFALLCAPGCGVAGPGTDDGDTGSDTDDGGEVVEIPPAPAGPDCAERECGPNGTCIVISDATVCLCEPGFLAQESEAGPCQPCPQAEDGPFERDLQPVTLQGEITVDGLSLEGDTVNRGTVELVGPWPGDRMNLGFVEAGDYSMEVLPGTYSLDFAFGTEGNLVPQNRRVRIRKKLVLDKDKTLDIDIQTGTVSGVVTFNGRPELDGPNDYGMLYLVDRATGGEVELGPTFEGAFFARVAHGTYDVVYEWAASLESAPANSRAVIAKKVVVDGTTSLDVDIPSVRLEGNANLTNIPELPEFPGLPFPLRVSTVVLRSTADGSTVRLGPTDSGRYEAFLIPGRYEVLVEPLAVGAGAPANPSARLWSVGEVFVESDQEFDLEIATVRVSGSIRIGGVELFDVGNYGDLYLHDVHEGRDVSLGPSFTGAYSSEILPGRYQVVYEGRASTGAAPMNARAVVVDDLLITADEVIDIDVPSVRMSGALRVEPPGDGEEPPDPIPDTDVGSVALFDRHTGATTPLGRFSDASYSAAVVPGTYDLLFVAPDFSGIARNARRPLAWEIDVTTDTVRDVTIAPLVRDFAFTIDGVEPESIVGANFYLRTDDYGDQARVQVNGESELLPGSYWLEYEGTGNSVIVENRRARLECVTF